jgi:hypothetical protein
MLQKRDEMGVETIQGKTADCQIRRERIHLYRAADAVLVAVQVSAGDPLRAFGELLNATMG